MNIDFRGQNINKYDFLELNNFFEKYKSYTGWTDLEKLSDIDLINKMKKYACEVRERCEVFLVVGIGGSYLGSKAIMDAINNYYPGNGPEIIFVGNTLSPDYMSFILEKVQGKSIYVNYISKSFSTLESKISFKIIEDYMKEKFKDYEDRIIYTTSKLELVPSNSRCLFLPDNIGGRYSVFTPVGLLPLLVSGINVDRILDGAKSVSLSDTFDYVSYRKSMELKNKKVEAFTIYEPSLTTLVEWLKQLFGESLGKNKQGMLPIGLTFTTDLHSLGQFVQDGSEIIYQTVIKNDSRNEIQIDKTKLSELNNIAFESTLQAHNEVANPIVINMGIVDEYNIGKLMQFFMLSCAVAGYLDNINPFDQEGVEVYKKIMNDKIKEMYG